MEAVLSSPPLFDTQKYSAAFTDWTCFGLKDKERMFKTVKLIFVTKLLNNIAKSLYSCRNLQCACRNWLHSVVVMTLLINRRLNFGWIAKYNLRRLHLQRIIAFIQCCTELLVTVNSFRYV